jgi:hypothetical protein
MQFVTNLSKYCFSPRTIVSDNFNSFVVSNVSVLHKNISTSSNILETLMMSLLQCSRNTVFANAKLGELDFS